MRKFLLLVFLCAVPAYADSVPLQITGGSVTTTSVTNFDYGFNLIGQNFQLNGVRAGFFLVADATGTGVVFVPLSSSGIDPFSSSTMILTQDRPLVFPDLTGQPFGTTASDFTHFTMTGHVITGNGFDIAGQGIAEARTCHVCQFEGLTLTWTFTSEPVSVPEPSSIGMLSAGLLAGLALYRRRRQLGKTLPSE
jgi:hypothetical protein